MRVGERREHAHDLIAGETGKVEFFFFHMQTISYI
jgi:hypothetical protein